MKYKKTLLISIAIFFSTFNIVNFTRASVLGFDTSTPCTYWKDVFDFSMSAAGILTLVMLVAGGLYYIVSLGQEERLGNAKSMMGGAMVGFVLAIFSWMIFNVISPSLLQCRIDVPEVDQGSVGNAEGTPECSVTEMSAEYIRQYGSGSAYMVNNAEHFADYINSVSRSAGIDPHYVATSIRRESGFVSSAGPSPTGAYGLFQFQPDTAANSLPSSAPSSCRRRVSGETYAASQAGRINFAEGYCLNRGGQEPECCEPQGSFQVCGRWGRGCQTWMNEHREEQIEGGVSNLLSYFLNSAGGDYQLATGMMMYGENGCRSNEDRCRNNVGPDNRGHRRTCGYWRDSCESAGGEFTPGYCEDLL